MGDLPRGRGRTKRGLTPRGARASGGRIGRAASPGRRRRISWSAARIGAHEPLERAVALLGFVPSRPIKSSLALRYAAAAVERGALTTTGTPASAAESYRALRGICVGDTRSPNRSA